MTYRLMLSWITSLSRSFEDRAVERNTLQRRFWRRTHDTALAY
jgi:hypothetical protein